MGLCTWWAATSASLSPIHVHFWAALVAGAVVSGLIGVGLETGFLRRLYNDEASQVLLTIGFIYILQNLTQWIWGTYPMGAPVPELLSKAVPVGSIDVPAYRFFLIGFGLLMAYLLWRFQDRTRVGSWVRAGMDNREITGTFGVNLKVLFTAIFALGSLIAGMCGVLGAPVTGMNLGIGWGALLLALIVVVIGGTDHSGGAARRRHHRTAQGVRRRLLPRVRRLRRLHGAHRHPACQAVRTAWSQARHAHG